MRRILLYTAAGLLAAGLFSGSATGQTKKPAKPDAEVCTGDFGTSVKFLAAPSEAARLALKEHKLVLVLHVSGDFEDPDFT